MDDGCRVSERHLQLFDNVLENRKKKVSNGKVNESDFTNSLIYIALKSGLSVPLESLAMHTFVDYISYFAKTEGAALGKNGDTSKTMTSNDLRKQGAGVFR